MCRGERGERCYAPCGGGADQATVGSSSKPGAGSEPEGSKAGLGSSGASPCARHRAGETGGWVGSQKGREEVGDRGRLGDEGDDSQRGTIPRTDPRKPLVDPRQSPRPQRSGIRSVQRRCGTVLGARRRAACRQAQNRLQGRLRFGASRHRRHLHPPEGVGRPHPVIAMAMSAVAG
jgi:hypothetical protein